MDVSVKRVIAGAFGFFAFIFGITILFGSWYTISEQERGVLLRNGSFVRVVGPGLSFKVPLIDDVVKVSTKTYTWKWEKTNSYSFDQQPADIDVSLTLRVDPAQVGQLYARYGTLDQAIRQQISPHVLQQTKVVFGQYTAVRAIQAREKLNADIKQAIIGSIKDDTVLIESVQVENIEYSKTYLHSIEERMLAEVEVQKLQQNAEREKVQALITVTKAKAQADSVRAQAQAEADAIRLRGEAEATAIKARGDALANSPNLVALVQAERWNGALPQTMIPSGAVPLLGMGK